MIYPRRQYQDRPKFSDSLTARVGIDLPVMMERVTATQDRRYRDNVCDCNNHIAYPDAKFHVVEALTIINRM